MNLHYLAYLFDFDYTLGDATNGIVLCANSALNSMGFPQYDRDDIRKTVGLTLPETFRRLTGVQDDRLAMEFAGLFKQKADVDMLANTELFSDTITVLEHLKGEGTKIGIVTTKFHYRIDQIVRKFHMESLIDGIVGGEDVQNAKPNPEGLLRLIDTFNISRKEALYIGDSLVDAETAQNASVDFIAVLTGTTTRDMHEKYPNRHIINSLSELIEI